MTPSYRKPNHRLGGKEVRICGQKLHTAEHNLICTLPIRHPKNIHGTIAIADDGSMIAVIDNVGSGEVDMWQLVAPPE